MIDLMTRGVGGSKVEAVRRAFKTMENRLIGVVMDLEENVETEQLKKQDDLCDSIVNFSDEESIMTVKSESNSTYLSPSPVFNAKDCITQDTGGREGGRVFN